MKVVEDKVTVYPPHAICKADVPVTLATLPKWTTGIQTVRLSSAQKENPTVIAFFHPQDGSLLAERERRGTGWRPENSPTHPPRSGPVTTEACWSSVLPRTSCN